MTAYLDTAQGRRIAYVKTEGTGPTILFLSGLKSDMEGTKAIALEAWAKEQGRAFLRFDYSGHGVSSGEFAEGSIGDWHEDTLEVVDKLIEGPILAVGSSMGGWQSLLLSRARPERVMGLVTIAAAPDFTEDGYWAGFTDAQKAELERKGSCRSRQIMTRIHHHQTPDRGRARELRSAVPLAVGYARALPARDGR